MRCDSHCNQLRSYPNSAYRPDPEFAQVVENELSKVRPVHSRGFRLVRWLGPLGLLGSFWLGVPMLAAVGLAGIAFLLLQIIRVNLEGNAAEACCPHCWEIASKEVQGNVEYFLCHGCQIWAMGRDWS